MKNILLFTIIFSVFNSLNSFAQTYGWIAIDVPPSVPNTVFTDVKFIGDVLWLTTFDVNPDHFVYRVTNNGTVWIPDTVATTTDAVYMFDENNGNMVGAGGAIYQTSNGGIDWQYLFNPLSNNLRSMDFPTGTAVGYICGNNGALAEINGVTVTQKTSGLVGDLVALSMPDTNNIWACGDEVVYHYVQSTGNGTIYNPAGIVAAYNGIHFVSATTGWAVGNVNGIYNTTNGGANWTQQTNPSSQALTDIFFLDDQYGWAVGTEGVILHTTNGGTIWIAQTSNTTEILEAVCFTSITEGYAVGANNTILKFGELTSVENEEESPTDFSLLQNYPNPFNPSTKIRFTIPNNVILSEAKNLVTLKVYDVLGNEVATLVNEEKPSGEYEVEFDASGLTSGIYFYQLRAGKFIGTKKMILIK